MSRASLPVLTATLLAASLLVNSATGRQQGSSDKTGIESFDDRMQMYLNWAQATHGRKLSDAYSPASSPAPSADFGGCKVLRYHTGYANLTVYFDKIIKDSPNFGECCHSCQKDPSCVAWTRVAGGDAANFRNCYLKYNIDLLDESLGKYDNNHDARGDAHPELRYVDTDYPTILESGTIPDMYPADYYGCPYAPGNAVTPCDAPATCNHDGSGNFVAPACI